MDKRCYVSMPFGVRQDPRSGQPVYFDRFYSEVLKPTVEALGLTCSRADELPRSGSIHKTTVEAIMNSRVMVADLSTANPNVLYEVGLRHALRPASTVLISRSGYPIPYSLSGCLALNYEAELEKGRLAGDAAREDLVRKVSREIASALESPRIDSPVHDFFPELRVHGVAKEPRIFVGHGRSGLWSRLQLFLQNELELPVETFETQSHVGESIVPVLERFLSVATFAILILTAEDETASGRLRARQNVVHEAGLFQGVLGFPRALVLKQKGLESFSNIDGLQYIEFEGDNITSTFWEVQRVLRREGLLQSE